MRAQENMVAVCKPVLDMPVEQLQAVAAYIQKQGITGGLVGGWAGGWVGGSEGGCAAAAANERRGGLRSVPRPSLARLAPPPPFPPTPHSQPPAPQATRW